MLGTDWSVTVVSRSALEDPPFWEGQLPHVTRHVAEDLLERGLQPGPLLVQVELDFKSQGSAVVLVATGKPNTAHKGGSVT